MSQLDRSAYFQECLQISNYLRKLHNVPPQQLDTKLTQMAQSHADFLARTNKFEHSVEARIQHRVGENIGCQSRTDENDETPDPLIFIYLWYNEIRLYKFDGQFHATTGHFTQVVWKASTKVGFGLASNENFHYFVANYLEPGNKKSHFAENVFRSVNRSVPLSFQEIGKVFGPKYENYKVTTKPDGTVETTKISNHQPSTPRDNSEPSEGSESSRHLGFSNIGRSESDRGWQRIRSKSPSRSPMRSPVELDNNISSGNNGLAISHPHPSQNKTVTKKSFLPDGSICIETTNVTVIPSEEINECIQKINVEGDEPEKRQSARETDSPRSISPDPIDAEELETFVTDVLKRLNHYRRLHGAHDLMLNEDLRVAAQNWADKVLLIGHWECDEDFKYKGKCPGMTATHHFRDDDDDEKVAHDIKATIMVNKCYEAGAKFYKVGTEIDENENTQKFGNFTQMLWKSSKVVGIGKARTYDRKRVVVVCYYYPPGNTYGAFRENVLPCVH